MERGRSPYRLRVSNTLVRIFFAPVTVVCFFLCVERSEAAIVCGAGAFVATLTTEAALRAIEVRIDRGDDWIKCGAEMADRVVDWTSLCVYVSVSVCVCVCVCAYVLCFDKGHVRR